MKVLSVFACVLGACALVSSMAMPEEDEAARRRGLPALQHEEIHDAFGQYSLRYVTAEGTVVSESGKLVPNAENDGHVLVYEGEVTHFAPDGTMYKTKYSSGLDGHHVEGDHLPKAPEAEPAPAA